MVPCFNLHFFFPPASKVKDFKMSAEYSWQDSKWNPKQMWVRSRGRADLPPWRASVSNEKENTGWDVPSNSLKTTNNQGSQKQYWQSPIFMCISESQMRKLVDKYNFTCTPKTLLAGAPVEIQLQKLWPTQKKWLCWERKWSLIPHEKKQSSEDSLKPEMEVCMWNKNKE